MRGRLAMGIAAAAMAGAPGLAQTAPDYGKAYQLALECFVAYGVSDNEAGQGWTAAELAANERAAHLSFDTAMRLGKLQGFENRRLNADLDRIQNEYTKTLANTPSLIRSKIAECQKVGLKG